MDLFLSRWCDLCDEHKPLTSDYFAVTKKEPRAFDFRCLECTSRFKTSLDQRLQTIRYYHDHYSDPEFQLRRKVRRQAGIELVRQGIERPQCCPRCNRITYVEMHHRTYNLDDVLDIEWLCRRCHRREHASSTL